MPDGTTLGVTPAASVSNGAYLAYNQIFSSLSTSIPIGGLSQDQTDLSVSSQLSPQAQNDYYKFNFESGSAIKLGFNNLVNTTITFDGSDIQDPFASDLRVQLLNSAGAVVADSAGTPDQQAAYNQLNSSDGLSASNGSYYVKVSYAAGTPINTQAYNFQLYSGTTYSNTFTTTALTQAYDPNLFVDAASSVTPASNLTVYTKTANLTPDIASTPLNIGDLITGGNATELAVNAQATTLNPQTNYSFNVQQSGAIKLSLANTTSIPTLLDAQLVDSQGNVIADNNGTQDQKDAFIQLTSGAGLQAASGQYSLKVGFAAGQDTGNPQTYNFQLNEGSTYSTVYSTSVTQTTDNNYAAGNNLGVYADSQAQLFTRQDFNQIDSTAASAVNIGWLKENVSSLLVNSRLSSADDTDYFNFTLQQGSSFNFAFNNLTDSSALHVQILDSSGSNVLADNQGNSDQQAAFAQLTSDSGLSANPGQYIVKVSYADGADKNTAENYSFQLYSGNSFTNEYTTTASAQTLQNFLLSGGAQTYSPATAAASLLTDESNGTSINVFNANIFNTNIFA